MRCKGCDYPLWDIAARACPECGLPFRPSDYQFAINSVRYCCPHCHQAYYGTGDHGHLIPQRFHCVSCARLIDMDEMLVLPRDGVPESVSTPDRMPWLERHRIGFWKALGGTWIRALGSPSRLADTIPRHSPDGSAGPTFAPAFGYAMLFTIVYMLLGLSFAFVPAVSRAASGPGGAALNGIYAFAETAVGISVSCVVLFMVWALLAHLTLRLTGSTPGGFSGTAAALGYASSTNFLTAIPCVGIFTLPVGLCWWGVVAVLMAKRIHRASTLRASCAFIVVPILLVAVIIGAGVVALSAAASRISSPTPMLGPTIPPTPPAPRSVLALGDRVAGACLSYRAREGTWPRTPLDLVRGGDMLASHLIYSGNSATTKVGVMTLDEIDLLLTEQIRTIADIAASERDHPSGIMRSGQVYLFTSDLPINDELRGVWIGAAVGRSGSTETLVAVHADGTIEELPKTQESVDAQNAIRRERALPELPPLSSWP